MRDQSRPAANAGLDHSGLLGREALPSAPKKLIQFCAPHFFFQAEDGIRDRCRHPCLSFQTGRDTTSINGCWLLVPCLPTIDASLGHRSPVGFETALPAALSRLISTLGRGSRDHG